MPFKKKALLSVILILMLIIFIFYIILGIESIWLRILLFVIVILSGIFVLKDFKKWIL